MKIPKNNPFQPLLALSKRIFQRFGPREKYSVGLFAFVAIASLIALGTQLYLNNTEAAPAYGGEYREAIVGVPRFINPALAITTEVDRDLTALVYSSLIKYSKDGELVPDLAESYEVSEDGRTYTFVLKEGLRWEDGTPITADDVVFTIELIQDPQYSSPLFQSWQGVNVTKQDGRTVAFTLPSAYPPFLENTTVGILPKHVWQDITPKNFALSDLNIQPIGSGRYKVDKFTKDPSGVIASYTLKVNENYHGKKPYINKVTLKFYNSEGEAIKAYNSKIVDGIAFISPSSLEDLKNDTANIHSFKMPRYFAVFINQDRNDNLKDKGVRDAIAHAVNVQEIINDVLLGHGQPARTAIPPTLGDYYNAEASASTYDLERAKSLLEEAGWKHLDEDGIREKQAEGAEEGTYEKLSFTLVTANRPELIQAAGIISEQLKDAGIELNISAKELGELQQDHIRSRSYELLMFGEVLGSIPDPFSFWHSTQKNDPGLNLSNYDNSEIDKILQDARQETNKEKRIEYYSQLQEKIASDTPAVFLYDPAYLYPVHKRVQGIEEAFIVDTSYRFLDIENWYIETKRKLN